MFQAAGFTLAMLYAMLMPQSVRTIPIVYAVAMTEVYSWEQFGLLTMLLFISGIVGVMVDGKARV